MDEFIAILASAVIGGQYELHPPLGITNEHINYNRMLTGLDQRRFGHQGLDNVLDIVLIATEDAAQDAQIGVIGGIWLVALHFG